MATNAVFRNSFHRFDPKMEIPIEVFLAQQCAQQRPSASSVGTGHHISLADYKPRKSLANARLMKTSEQPQIQISPKSIAVQLDGTHTPYDPKKLETISGAYTFMPSGPIPGTSQQSKAVQFNANSRSSGRIVSAIDTFLEANFPRIANLLHRVAGNSLGRGKEITQGPASSSAVPSVPGRNP